LAFLAERSLKWSDKESVTIGPITPALPVLRVAGYAEALLERGRAPKAIAHREEYVDRFVSSTQSMEAAAPWEMIVNDLQEVYTPGSLINVLG
jgi:hypothetical protein